jgi:hypothetical protein
MQPSRIGLLRSEGGGCFWQRRKWSTNSDSAWWSGTACVISAPRNTPALTWHPAASRCGTVTGAPVRRVGEHFSVRSTLALSMLDCCDGLVHNRWAAHARPSPRLRYTKRPHEAPIALPVGGRAALDRLRRQGLLQLPCLARLRAGTYDDNAHSDQSTESDEQFHGSSPFASSSSVQFELAAVVMGSPSL